MVIFIALLMAAIAVVIVVWPIVRGRSALSLNGGESDPVLGELMVRREAVLTAIKDLEFDHAVGKIEEEDFQVLNAQLRAEAIEVLKELDRRLGMQVELETQLEQEIAQRRRGKGSVSAALDTQIEAEIAALRRGAVPVSWDGPACPRCGASLDEGDRFCKHCGTPIRVHRKS